MYSSSQGCHTATGTHKPHGITQCYLQPGRGDIPALTPAEAGTRLSDPGGMQGWVDLCAFWLLQFIVSPNATDWLQNTRLWKDQLRVEWDVKHCSLLDGSAGKLTPSLMAIRQVFMQFAIVVGAVAPSVPGSRLWMLVKRISWCKGTL